MPFVPVPDTVMVEIVFELDGQVVENTQYYTRTGAWAEGDILDLLIAVQEIVSTVLLPLLSSTLKLVRLVGTLLDAVDAIKVVRSVGTPVGGGQAGAPLPNNSAYVVTFNTTGRGRSGRGRNYIPGLCITNEVSGNTVSDSFRTGLLSYFNEVKAAASELGATMVVVSRFSGVDVNGDPIPRTVGVTKPITSFSTFDRTLDSQRRRLPGRGQ